VFTVSGVETVKRRKKGTYKTEVVAVRLTPRFKQILEQLAISEDLDLSAWIRNLIIKELKSRGVLPEISLTAPAFERFKGLEEGKES